MWLFKDEGGKVSHYYYYPIFLEPPTAMFFSENRDTLPQPTGFLSTRGYVVGARYNYVGQMKVNIIPHC